MPRRVEVLLHGAGQEGDDPPEVEEPGHQLRHPLDRALDVHALPEEDPVHHSLRAHVDRVEEEHDAEGHDGGRHDGRAGDLEARQDEVQEHDRARIAQDAESGHRRVDGARPHRRPEIEEVVP